MLQFHQRLKRLLQLLNKLLKLLLNQPLVLVLLNKPLKLPPKLQLNQLKQLKQVPLHKLLNNHQLYQLHHLKLLINQPLTQQKIQLQYCILLISLTHVE